MMKGDWEKRELHQTYDLISGAKAELIGEELKI
jgi:hypothetical protein